MQQRIENRETAKPAGIISSINGPVVTAERVGKLAMAELVEVSEERLLGEVIRLSEAAATVQVYENTTGLQPGSPLYDTGHPLSAELGPGIIGRIFDGLQRPLGLIKEQTGSFMGRGIRVSRLDHDKKWHFTPSVKEGYQVSPGALIGTVPETTLIEHRVLIPPRLTGKITSIKPEGDYTIDETIATLSSQSGDVELKLAQNWPVRQGRPYRNRDLPTVPLITGQRVIDTFFPIAKGGVAAIPGGFGTGKTVTQHQLARWADANVIVYVGCGERGNEMTEVLRDFPELTDPNTGRPLMERTILIANTSNMPVAAREASIYTGMTLAEYYRDMGYHVAIMADSTSRWAEAIREIAGRLEEMPAEEGFPAYLPSRLAEFYERAGRVTTLGGREGSITAIGAVSPPGGDFSEPVTQHTKRFVRCFWALDSSLAAARHYPAINWITSYSEYLGYIEDWWAKNVDPNWRSLHDRAMALLVEENRLQEVVRLIGPSALPNEQRLILSVAGIIRDGFLQQSAMIDPDSYTSLPKQAGMIKAIIHFFNRANGLVRRGAPVSKIMDLPAVDELLRMKYQAPEDPLGYLSQLQDRIDEQMSALEKDYS